MNFKYRVKGKVKAGFILRGLYHPTNTDIDICVYAEEFNFVKERCSEVVVEDLDKPVLASPESIQKEEIKPKVVTKNEKSTSGTSSRKYKK